MIGIRLTMTLMACLALAACNFVGSQSAGSDQAESGVPTMPAVAERAPGTIAGAGRRQTFHCDGVPVTVRGRRDAVHLVGQCPAVTVTGSGNRIVVDRAGSITVTGHANTVSWGGGLTGAAGTPRVADTGSGNVVRRGARPAEDRRPRT